MWLITYFSSFCTGQITTYYLFSTKYFKENTIIMKRQMINNAIWAVTALFLLTGLIFTGCSSSTTETEVVEVPTEGLITTVQEVEAEIFKIEDEVSVADTADSRIIANYMDATSDTFTLEEARLIEASGSTGREGSVVRSAGLGYFGFIMLGRMGGVMPRAGAYTSSSAHSKASSTAGSRMKSSANRVTRTRPSSGKSGYGSGKSTRSYGG